MPGSTDDSTDGMFAWQWPYGGALARMVAVASISGVLIAGCATGEGKAEVAAVASSSASPEQPASPEAPELPQVEIEFAYQPPDPPCPPHSALTGLPSEQQYPYTLSNSFLDDGGKLHESIRNIFVICSYEPAVAADDESVVLLSDHLILVAEMTLFRSWAESYWPDAVPEFPLASDDIHDWVFQPDEALSYRGVWRKGCEPGASSCTANGEPAARNYYWYLRHLGHVGNLQFELIAYYVTGEPPPETNPPPGTETPPPGAGETTVRVMRDFVRTVVDTWEHAN